jgi:hypothetical protein
MGIELVQASIFICIFLLLCSCSKRESPPNAKPQSESNSAITTAVETLLIGRWNYDSYDIVLSADHHFEVIAEPGYPGDVHKPPTGTWRLAGNKLIQKYDGNGFEEWMIQSLATGNLRMTSSGAPLEFRRVGAFKLPNPDALEATAQRELAAPAAASPSPASASAATPVTDALSRLVLGEWGDQNNTVFRYNADHTLTFSNREFPSTRYNNNGTWRIEGDRLVHILKDNETKVRRLVSITADKMVALEDTMTWELAHLTPVTDADAGTLAAIERAAEDQLVAVRSAREKAIASTQATPTRSQESVVAPAAPRTEPMPPEPKTEGPANANEFLEIFRMSPSAFNTDQLEKGKVYKINGAIGDYDYFQIMEIADGALAIGDPRQRSASLIALLVPQNPEVLETTNIHTTESAPMDPSAWGRAVGTFAKFQQVELVSGAAKRLPVFIISGLQLSNGKYINMAKK